MRTLCAWDDGEYCWEDDSERAEQEGEEGLLEQPCPACGYEFRECVCPFDTDPFEEQL